MKWITREHVKVDRVACPWLISKFVDKSGTWMKINRNWEYWEAHQYDTK